MSSSRLEETPSEDMEAVSEGSKGSRTSLDKDNKDKANSHSATSLMSSKSSLDREANREARKEEAATHKDRAEAKM